MTPRQKTYLGVRGASAGIFLFSATVLPHGAPAVIGALIGGVGGILTCFAINAGGPGERAGARVERLVYDTKRAPQGDWPPFPPEKVVDGHVVT